MSHWSSSTDKFDDEVQLCQLRKLSGAFQKFILVLSHFSLHCAQGHSVHCRCTCVAVHDRHLMMLTGANSCSVVVTLIFRDLYYNFTRPLQVRTAVTLTLHRAAVASRYGCRCEFMDMVRFTGISTRASQGFCRGELMVCRRLR